ncbi:histidine kinase [Clostridium sp. AL.422]|uniref:sensor histidine kinase n=1 Tax=Clostridium TaxID=1485 RepID=UPI00293DEBFF|nr:MULTISPECIES: histidine kinase [unclassified Clostridium]MDV4151852.1 histidine kinase [Clostridium sp. AL.422]
MKSLKSKIIMFAIILIIPLVTSNIITLIMSKRINDNYSLMLYKLNETNDVKNLLNESFNYFSEYFLTSDLKSKTTYEYNISRSIEKLSTLEEASDIESRYILRDISNTIRSYKSQGDKTIQLFTEHGAIDAYYDQYMSTKDMLSYCNSFITKLNESYIKTNNIIYNESKKNEAELYKIVSLFITITTFIIAIYTFIFIKDILNKLQVLVYASKNVSKGNFKEIKAKKTDIYEINILYEAFDKMIRNLKGYIDSLKENAELEAKIKDDEMKLLKYENALKLSQLKVLQSQINPHFLFNTLNCINQTAISENAYKTEELITSASGMLRYSLSMMERNATLADEINVVKQYIFIQKVRYDYRLTFNLNINCNITDIIVPGMTLQPFVENAFIHGIEPKEDGGYININIFKELNDCIVTIEDNGCGIDEDTLRKIKSGGGEKEHIGHTTGLGVKSVVDRLEIMYGEKDMFDISSEEGQGTKIFLRIPNKELNYDVKNSYS